MMMMSWNLISRNQYFNVHEILSLFFSVEIKDSVQQRKINEQKTHRQWFLYILDPTWETEEEEAKKNITKMLELTRKT